jgi:hypothetical protein
MHDNRDDYEPIIATRRSPKSQPEDAKPLWPLVLALGGGLAVIVVLAWWFMGRSPADSASTTAQSESSAPEFGPDIQVEQPPAPPARDSETDAEIAAAPAPPASAAEPAGAEQATSPEVTGEEATPEAAGQDATPEAPAQESTSESIPEIVPENAEQNAAPDNSEQAPVAPTPVPVHFVSPDAQVRFELRGPLDSSPPMTSKVGDVVAVAPGTYRVVVSGAQLETFEQKVTFDGERSLEYTVELCAERKHERENLTGRVVEERACASAAQCESMFLVLGEEADQLVKDRDFRTQQCAKWRASAVPEGTWTLDTKCGGATAASTCRIEIAQGACTFAEPPRSARGGECPRGELR